MGVENFREPVVPTIIRNQSARVVSARPDFGGDVRISTSAADYCVMVMFRVAVWLIAPEPLVEPITIIALVPGRSAWISRVTTPAA